MLVNMQKHMESRDATIDQILAHNKIVDNQIAQLSATLQARQQGALPAQPTRPTDQAFAITLRSGSNYEGPPMPRVDEPVLLNNANLDSVKPNNVVDSPAGIKDSTNISNSTLQGMTPEKMAISRQEQQCSKANYQTSFPQSSIEDKLG